MQDMVDNNNLKLHVTNFGPIVDADIDLRPLTVFVGPSNTGKSYLAILIYALHRFFSGVATGPNLGFRESTFRRSSIDDMTIEDANNMINWMIEWLPTLNHDESYLTVPPPIANVIRPALALQQFAPALPNDILRCFGMTGLGRIIRHGNTPQTAVVLTKHAPTNTSAANTFKYALVVNIAAIDDIELVNADFHAEIPESVSLRIERNAIVPHLRADISHLSSLYTLSRSRSGLLNQEFGSLLADMVGSSIVAPLTRAAYYLPAGRTSLMHQLRMMISSVVSSASHITFETQQVRPGLSGVISDFLQQLINLDDVSHDLRVSDPDVSKRLEGEMLGGAIRIDVPDVGIPVFTYQPKGWKEPMPLMNSSSMVSELAPVVLYLRHVVQPGDVLIIEEPEAHLHPGMQVEFIRQLAAAVRSGVRVMLTTHSEWVLEELANLVRLSDLPESHREGVGDWDVALSPEEVGVWLFEHKKRPRGSVVKEIQLDQDIGGFASGYDDVAIGTYNKWARIGNLISGARNGS